MTLSTRSFRSLMPILVLSLLLPTLARGAEEKKEDGKEKKAAAAKPHKEVEEAAKSGHTFTNADLKSLERGGVSTLGGSSLVGSTVPPASRTHPEEWWQSRAGMYEKRLRELEAQLTEMKTRLARASNPYTRAMAGTIKDEDGNERPATPADLRAEIARIESARAAETRGLDQLHEAARQQKVPEQWLRPAPGDNSDKDTSE